MFKDKSNISSATVNIFDNPATLIKTVVVEVPTRSPKGPIVDLNMRTIIFIIVPNFWPTTLFPTILFDFQSIQHELIR